MTRHGFGARGVDFVRVQRKSGTGSWADHASGWPVYDTHGNNVGMLTLSGSTYTLGDERTYDAWGSVRASSGSPPEQGYCANLGHRSDGESSLVYMRARYYEPGTGRFISEDPARDGANWYVYCGNNPVNFVDYSGKEESWANALLGVGSGFISMAMIIARYECSASGLLVAAVYAAIGVALAAVASLTTSDLGSRISFGIAGLATFLAGVFTANELRMIVQMTEGMGAGSKSHAGLVVGLCYINSLALLAMLKEMDLGDIAIEIAQGGSSV